MKVDRDLLKKLATLSRLEIEEEAEAGLISDLQQMVTFIEQLQQVEVEGVEPMISPVQHAFNGVADLPEPSLDQDRMLQQAPDRQGPYFRLPKVVEKGEAS